MARYIIEVAQSQNENHIFAPTRARVRGRWDFSNTAARNLGSEALREMAREVKVIPGQHILLDTDHARGVIYDPLLDTDDGRRVWLKLKGIISRYKHEFGSDLRPHDPSELSNLGADQIKQWLWEMRCLLDGNQAVLVSGSDPVPSFEEIARMPGRRLRDPMNTGVQEKDLKKFVDVVPEGKKQTAGSA